jgi:hypothetical protein
MVSSAGDTVATHEQDTLCFHDSSLNTLSTFCNNFMQKKKLVIYLSENYE